MTTRSSNAEALLDRAHRKSKRRSPCAGKQAALRGAGDVIWTPLCTLYKRACETRYTKSSREQGTSRSPGGACDGELDVQAKARPWLDVSGHYCAPRAGTLRGNTLHGKDAAVRATAGRSVNRH